MVPDPFSDLAEFDSDRWDQEFDEDVAAGRLDDLAEEALRDLREGRCTGG